MGSFKWGGRRKKNKLWARYPASTLHMLLLIYVFSVLSWPVLRSWLEVGQFPFFSSHTPGIPACLPHSATARPLQALKAHHDKSWFYDLSSAFIFSPLTSNFNEKHFIWMYFSISIYEIWFLAKARLLLCPYLRSFPSKNSVCTRVLMTKSFSYEVRSICHIRRIVPFREH